MHHNTAVWIGAALTFAGVLWTCFWIWVWWMAITVLRWHYLAVRAAKRPGAALAGHRPVKTVSPPGRPTPPPAASW